MTGRFIVFEGIDGSGTSTQALHLQQSLQAIGLRVALTSEPSAGPVGHIIRQILTHRSHVSADERVVSRQLAYLFAADRHDHLYNDIDGIVSHLAAGKWVICTRYWLSSLAYNSADAQADHLVMRLNEGFPIPDLTVYLDCSVTEGLRRIAAQERPPDIHETEDRLHAVRDAYERILPRFTGQLARVAAEQTSEAVQLAVRESLADEFGVFR